jgi:hypothetical protein
MVFLDAFKAALLSLPSHAFRGGGYTLLQMRGGLFRRRASWRNRGAVNRLSPYH